MSNFFQDLTAADCSGVNAIGQAMQGPPVVGLDNRIGDVTKLGGPANVVGGDILREGPIGGGQEFLAQYHHAGPLGSLVGDAGHPNVDLAKVLQGLSMDEHAMEQVWQNAQGPGAAQWAPMRQQAPLHSQPHHIPGPWAPAMGGMPMGMMGNMGPMHPMMRDPAMMRAFDLANKQEEPKAREHKEPSVEDVQVEPAPAQVDGQGGMGMGMDQAMLDQLMTSDDPKWRNSKFLKFINQINRGEIEFQDNQVVPVNRPLLGHDAVNPGAEAELKDAQGLFQDLSPEQWLQKYTQGYDNQEDWMQNIRSQQQAPKDPEYVFTDENPHVHEADPYQEGIRLLKEGKLKEAILAFEAAVKKTPDNAEAWRYLGQAQAENESEAHAIAALLKCISLDPYNLPALMLLGVSYTNDLDEGRALIHLKTWLLNNPDYQGAGLEAAWEEITEYEQLYGGGRGFDGGLHDQIKKLFLKARDINSEDADLHTVLGVLFHISNEFDESIECFKSALRIRPDDAQLWNKLGATQANSSRSAEAVHAYRRALQLRPNYVRALANLAISFANQGMHEDAARTYLATLAQNPEATHVWSYLRISLTSMGRNDLAQLTESKDVNKFRPHFTF